MCVQIYHKGLHQYIDYIWRIDEETKNLIEAKVYYYMLTVCSLYKLTSLVCQKCKIVYFQ